MISFISKAWGGIKTYVIAGLAVLSAILSAAAMWYKASRDSAQKDAAEAQRDVLIDANEAMNKAIKEGDKHEEEAIKRARNGDWSDFNRMQ